MENDILKINKINKILESEIGGYWSLIYREQNKHRMPNTITSSKSNPPKVVNGFYADTSNVMYYDLLTYNAPGTNINYYYKYINRPRYESMFEMNNLLYSFNNRITALETTNMMKDKKENNNLDAIISNIHNFEKNLEDQNKDKYEQVKEYFSNIISEFKKINEILK